MCLRSAKWTFIMLETGYKLWEWAGGVEGKSGNNPSEQRVDGVGGKWGGGGPCVALWGATSLHRESISVWGQGKDESENPRRNNNINSVYLLLLILWVLLLHTWEPQVFLLSQAICRVWTGIVLFSWVGKRWKSSYLLYKILHRRILFPKWWTIR